MSHVGPQETANDLFNPKYTGVYPMTPLTPGRVKTMSGLLDGTISKGNLWFAYYFGDIDVFTGKADASGKPIKVFGLSKSGDPLHPLRLPYTTNLVDWVRR